MRFDVLNGPNLNLLGSREPGLYGTEDLAAIYARLAPIAQAAGASLTTWQGNGEGELVDAIQRAGAAGSRGIVLNAGAYTHTSVAVRDALLAVQVPFVEVHLSNVFARETFRHQSMFADIAVGVVSGLGARGYEAALGALIARASAG